MITPILKSGGYIVKTDGDKASPDFTGYETAYYLVTPLAGIKFESTTLHRDGIIQNAARDAIHSPGLLARVSKPDHEMAMLAARDPRELTAPERRNEGSEDWVAAR